MSYLPAHSFPFWCTDNRSYSQTLYAGTIRFNILLGATKPREEVTQEELEQACRNANILSFIESLPEYVHYPVLYLRVGD